ncbi:MAG: AsmA-like C-terminal region-containing protein, partial [Schleiferiaceae bacterium]|nr:AsmA-like C-terminal region-containing protein [Schleiferiaceae bacterium]
NSFGEIQTLAFSNANFSGRLNLENGYLKFTNSNFDLQNIQAEAALNGKNLLLHNLSLSAGDNELKAKGQIIDVLNFTNIESIPKLAIHITAPKINAKEIAEWQFGEENSGQGDLPFYFETRLHVDHFFWDDFNGYNLRGQVYGDANKISGRNLKFNSSKGEVNGNFEVNSKDRLFSTQANIAGLDIQNLFKEFNNFGQTDLTNKNIKGTLDAQFQFNSAFDENWDFISQKIELESQLKISNGELINYKPLESLKKFASEEDLKRVQFSTLENEIFIKKGKIIIPEMHIASNALKIDLEGTHGFDSKIDYSIRLLLSKVIGGERKGSGGYDDFVVLEERPDQPFIWVNVGCTVDDPCTSIDSKKMGETAKNKWKNQGKELKELWKNDTNKTQSEESEFIFEWEEEPDTNKR